MRANHKDKKGLKRGQCFLNRETIYRDCHLKIEGITINSVDNAIRYLRQHSMLTTQQTTRGFIATICNYGFYQNLDNYKNEAKNEAETNQKRTRNEPINNNVNNVNNERNNIYSEILKNWNSNERFPKHSLNGRIGKKIKNEIDKLIKDGESIEDIKTVINNYAKIIHSEKYFFKYIWNLDDFLKRGYNKFKNWEIAHSNFSTGNGSEGRKKEVENKYKNLMGGQNG